MKFEAAAVALAIALTIPCAAPAHDFRIGDIGISQPWARASIGKARNGAAFLTIHNDGNTDDRLTGASTSVAKGAALHSHVVDGDVVKMRRVEAIKVIPGEPTVFEPGGWHIMLMGLSVPLIEGQTFPLELDFAVAGTVTIQVEVRKPAAMGPKHEHESHAPVRRQAKHTGQDACRLAIEVTKEAERRPGGALYAGQVAQHHAHQGTSQADMKGAHRRHKPQWSQSAKTWRTRAMSSLLTEVTKAK